MKSKPKVVDLMEALEESLKPAPEYTTDSCCSAEHPCPTHRDLYA